MIGEGIPMFEAERLTQPLRNAMRFLDYAAGEGIVLNTGGEELDAGDIMSELVDAFDVAYPEADIVEQICASILTMAEDCKRMREAATRYLDAQTAHAEWPANDATKAFDRMLKEVEFAEDELRRALGEEKAS